MQRVFENNHIIMFPEEIEERYPSIYRPKPTIRLVPLTNGILYNDNRRLTNSYCERGYSDRFTSTSTSSQCDTEIDFGNGNSNEHHCTECHGHANQRYRSSYGRNRYSLPRMGYSATVSNTDDPQATHEKQTMSRGSQLRRRRRSRTVGCVYCIP